MDRRRVLSAIGGSAAMLSLAGCTGSDDSDESGANGDEESGSNSENGDEETESIDREELIAAAAGSLDEAVGEFETVIEDDPLENSSDDVSGGEENEDEDDEPPSVDTDRIETLLDEAETDIETAREGASDEQLETLDSLAAVADFLRDLLPALSAVNDAMTAFEEADQYIDDEEYHTATDAVGRATSHIETAIEETTIAGATFDEIDAAGLESVDALEYDALSTSFDDFDALLEAMDIFLAGMEQMIEAMVPFQSGLTALQSEQFQTAATEFEAASEQFYRSYTTLDEGAADVSGDYREDLLELACELEALSDATDLFAQGSEAYAAGDYQQGQTHFEDADAVMDRCSDETEGGTAMPSIR